ncbi:3-dehydroquinate synthase [Bacillus canaveralius]|uniref:3-dehydroquinate synthase n=1 Tax=Bacillus canaveralius TaxID=1403243 RepID=A0A2N5GRS2_9BACI|nr:MULTISPECIES: 3-dehydroquinate synthase [Bacillus]PLR82653.1 3-dehydroquinate synthase [Bacillus sp. V33-4]PLR86142.1 3-dehydroquinate synthase [Bacillus canaveralius]PLS00262.1 3-dehydroquinate synthase [Bacillus canaveralius]RSK51974.1 3-dehydroquinate synthase [Bacillus canaveralius]
MATLNVKTDTKEYPVFIGAGVSGQLAGFLKEHFPHLTSLLVITDETVGALYLDDLKTRLSAFPIHAYPVPAGEKAKTFEVYYQVLTYALEQKLDRHSLVIALGGGAVGDLAGFAAATFMRGIPFIQVPTTILAHDSAVGGKVAINHPIGKNMIGAFYQPEAVFYDLDYLSSLPIAEKRSGFAEVVKEALISDKAFYSWLRNHIHSLESIARGELEYALTNGIKIKGEIVAEDEKETGVRAYLNFGHTLGHAIEAEYGYGSITHGEAVMIGTVFALQLSKHLHSLEFKLTEFTAWLGQLGYETAIPAGLSAEKMIERMKQDKKSVGQKVRFVLLKEVGTPVLTEIPDSVLLDYLKNFLATGRTA